MEHGMNGAKAKSDGGGCSCQCLGVSSRVGAAGAGAGQAVDWAKLVEAGQSWAKLGVRLGSSLALQRRSLGGPRVAGWHLSVLSTLHAQSKSCSFNILTKACCWLPVAGTTPRTCTAPCRADGAEAKMQQLLICKHQLIN